VIRVLIVDDEALVRAGLAMILSSAADLTVVGEVADGSSVLAAVQGTNPDVVVMDIRMPTLDGLSATRQIVALPGHPQVLVLTTFDLDKYVFGALEAGAAGFLLKDTPPAELIEAVRIIAQGHAMLSPRDTRRLIDRYAGNLQHGRQTAAHRRLATLSPREQEVAAAVTQGLANTEIAGHLYCSEATVKAHLTHIFTKTGCDNRVQLALLVRDAGLDPT
jgi:DNA-binding NarL/FixJ family response regulator